MASTVPFGALSVTFVLFSSFNCSFAFLSEMLRLLRCARITGPPRTARQVFNFPCPAKSTLHFFLSLRTMKESKEGNPHVLWFLFLMVPWSPLRHYSSVFASVAFKLLFFFHFRKYAKVTTRTRWTIFCSLPSTKSLRIWANFRKKRRLRMREPVVEPAYWLALLVAVFCRRICLWGESVSHCPTYTSIVLSCLVVVRRQRRYLGNTVCLSAASPLFARLSSSEKSLFFYTDFVVLFAPLSRACFVHALSERFLDFLHFQMMWQASILIAAVYLLLLWNDENKLFAWWTFFHAGELLPHFTNKASLE